MTFQNLGPSALIIGEDMVTIDLKDGSIKFGPTYKPDLAAQTFWDAISGEYRDYLKWKAAHPQ
jgi:hypothetical protein